MFGWLHSPPNHTEEFCIEVKRTKLDPVESRALSAEALDKLWQEMFPQALKHALMTAMQNGVMMPRHIKVTGKFEVSE